MLAAMGPPGGGRNHVTHRFLRHFNIISIETFDDETMRSIFQPIAEWHFTKGFDNSLRRYARVKLFILCFIFRCISFEKCVYNLHFFCQIEFKNYICV